MTDPLGKHWDQPDREEIAISTYCASMRDATFLNLPEYSASIPTGMYAGKMWRANCGDCWELRWYEDNPNPKLITIKSKAIIITDAPEGQPNIALVIT